MKNYLVLFLYLIVSACNNAHQTLSISDSVTVSGHSDAVVTEKQPALMSCDTALTRMLQTSNYNPGKNLHLSDYCIRVDEYESDASSLALELFFKGGNGRIGVMNLDLQTGKLVDLSPNLEKEMEITYDSSWLKVIKTQCGQ